MFLKSLELNGFKSFASKTTLDFPSGITAIVGPNGSGKSNVIDAIRWLLGERDAKNLRGAKTEDLIFNGTASKARGSMAQVGLRFENNNEDSQIDFKEVSVVRQVGRDGVSQYFINKAESRLKDVVDFFNRSRLGTKGLIIINQGSSDLFVRASNEERRIMIEEILGLREYEVKKSESERKLKNTFFNLEKVGAMIEEVMPRLRLLKRQTGKWEKRLDIQKELDDLEQKYYSTKIGEIESQKMRLESLFNSIEKQISEKKKELIVLEDEVKKIESTSTERPEFKEIKRRQNELLEQRSRIQKELGRLEAKIEFLGNIEEDKGSFKNEELISLIKEIKSDLQSYANFDDIGKLRLIISDLVVKIENFFAKQGVDSHKKEELINLEKNKHELTVEFELIEEKLKEIEKTEKEVASNLEEFQARFRNAFEAIEVKKDEITELENQKNKFLFEKERWDLKFHDLEDQLSQIGRNVKEFLKDSNNNEKLDFEEVEKRIFKLRVELANIGEVDESLIKEMREVEDHYNFLNKQSKDLEKAAVDLKNLIKELNEKIHDEFNSSLRSINEEFNKFFKLIFEGGSAKLKLKEQGVKLKVKKLEIEEEKNNIVNENKEENEEEKEEKLPGIEIELSLPKKRITGLEMLSGGEKSLVSIAALFSLISISPPPFLILDEIDAALDENNSKRFAELIKKFAQKTQFIIVTHNRSVMESANVLYGVTMNTDGTSRILSLKLES